MSEKKNIKYKQLPELAAEIKEKTEQLTGGGLDLETLGHLIGEVRDLEERLVILRYKALESGQKNGSDPATKRGAQKPENKEKDDQPAKKKKRKEPIPFGKAATSKKKKRSSGKERSKKKAEVRSEPISKENIEAPEKKAGLVEGVRQAREEKEDAQPTLNEKHSEKAREEEAQALVNQLGIQSVENLKTAIGLNDKFRFINELFDGDAEAYNEAIEQLNNADGYDSAGNYLKKELKPKYEWEVNSKTVKLFTQLVKMRHE